jgi:hypothetical protein
LAIVFVCRTCRTAVCMEGPPRPYPLVYAGSAAKVPGPPVLAPFWRIRGRAAWKTDAPAKLRTYTNLRPLGPLMFPAFWSPKAAYYDNLTIRYALASTIEEGAAVEGTLLDGTRGTSALQELARLTWLGYMDRVADVTGVELDFHAEGVDYVCVPFGRDGDGLVEGVLGAKLPAAYLAGG